MNASVDEVIAVAGREGIDADLRKGGELTVARNAAQLGRLADAYADECRWPDTDVELLDADETAGRVRVAGAVGGLWHPHCARVQPAKLVVGIAAAVDRLGGTIMALTRLLRGFFPAAAGTRVAHAWSGVLGVPRDWTATVGYDPATGLGWAGGYVGTGVAATNLAGRTLADLVLGRDTERTRLPWVGHRARRWEIEPLRWLGVHAVYAGYHLADRQEASGRTSTAPVARLADVIAGR